MGLLSFKKKSRKQRQLNDKLFELSHHYQPPPKPLTFAGGSLSKSNTLEIESSNPRDTRASLMDDIMNELDSARSTSNCSDEPPISRQNKGARPSPLLMFDSPSSSVPQQQQSSSLSSSQMPVYHAATAAAKNPAFMTSHQHSSAPTISIPAVDNNKASRKSMQKQLPQHQPKPNPLLSFSDSNLNLNSSKNVGSDIADQDDLKAILVSKPASPPTLVQQQIQTQTQTAASPPAYNIATNNNTSKNLMDRMKERHRLEARQSLQPSPFMDNTQARTNNLSSPSMPIIYSATTTANSPITAITPKDIRPSPKPLVQSHSFTTYAKPTSTHIAIAVNKQRPKQQPPLVRSVSDMNDMYTVASKPIQTQSDISLHKRASPSPPLKQLRMPQSSSITNVRNSYLQTGPVMSVPYEEEQDMFRAPVNTVSPMRLQLNRSVSAYPSFPQQSLQQHQQQQMDLQQRQQMEMQQQHILQQQKQQHMQQQHMQQQIELQQQQIQEQQRLQQQKLQQLQIQQQQILNQTLMETTAAAAVAASTAAAPLKINQHSRDAPKMAIVRSESRLIDTKHTSKSKPASKYNQAPRPLYERSSSPPSSSSLGGGVECAHSRCRQQQQQQHYHCHCHCRPTSPTSNNNRVAVLHSSRNKPDTPPPELHHTTMFSKESTEQASLIEDDDNPPENKLMTIEETLIANSSTSTLTEGDDIVATTTTTTNSLPNKTMSKVIRLPEKLKQELQSMQLRRSTYSVPDLTTFSSDYDDDATERQKDWSTIEMFDSGIIANEPLKEATSFTAADINPSRSSSELLMFDSNKHSEDSFYLELDSSCGVHHQHHSQQLHHHRHNHHHHHHKRHRCSKRYSTCCSSLSRKNHPCPSSKHNTSLHKSFSTYSMDMPASVLTTFCSHQPGKRHHHHHHHHHHHQANKHWNHRCHDNNLSSSRYTLVLRDDEDEVVL
ncbi:uncharacterized protein ATC70_006966 [Mucor velutinosus]|uniref:Uncharacterized protein n=1 Tax=Mucor velutinosus TaxID=708070 RepID=A0AAN7D3R9_9FUNG|nr:hypothetical protein ATC70_006966 [Mucor velutinosus]